MTLAAHLHLLRRRLVASPREPRGEEAHSREAAQPLPTRAERPGARPKPEAPELGCADTGARLAAGASPANLHGPSLSGEENVRDRGY